MQMWFYFFISCNFVDQIMFSGPFWATKAPFTNNYCPKNELYIDQHLRNLLLVYIKYLIIHEFSTKMSSYYFNLAYIVHELVIYWLFWQIECHLHTTIAIKIAFPELNYYVDLFQFISYLSSLMNLL